MQVFNFRLDCDAIDVVCTKSNNLFETVGDCGDEMILQEWVNSVLLMLMSIHFPNSPKD